MAIDLSGIVDWLRDWFPAKSDVKNNLTSTNTDLPLSANQGKVLKGYIDGKANSSHTHPDTQITWNGTNTQNSVSPLDMAMYEEFNANRLAYLSGDYITVEYSTNGGSTWSDYNATATQKMKLITTEEIFTGGKGSTTDYSKNQLRITINAGDITSTVGAKVYLVTRKLMIYFCECNASNTKVLIEKAPYTADTTFSTVGTYDVKGWTGWNSIPLNITFGGYANQGTANQVKKLRLTFTCTGGTGNFRVHRLRLFGETQWTVQSNLARTGHLYSYNENQDVTFPAKIIKSGGTSSQFLKADGSVDSTTYVATGDSRLSDSRIPKFTDIGASSSNEKDLNTYRTGGFYYIASDANSKYIDHCPLPKANNVSFFLLVETWGASHNQYVKQTLTYYTTNKTYVRTKTGNNDANTNWKPWKLISTSTEYIVGTQTASTNAWTGKANDISSLESGQVIYYKLSKASTNADVTLNLTLADGTTTGAKNVWFWNGSRVRQQYGVNSIIGLIYNGSEWWVINPSTNANNNNYYLVNGVQITNGEDPNASTPINFVTGNIVGAKKDGKYYKLVNGLVLDVSYPLVMANGTINAGAVSNTIVLVHPFLATTGIGMTTGTITANYPLYLEGTYSRGQFTVSAIVCDNSTHSTLTNGKNYIRLGTTYDATHFRFVSDMTVYRWDSTAGYMVPVGSSYTDLANKPSSFTPSSHTHGNLQNNGQVGSTAVNSGIVLTDSSGKITASTNIPKSTVAVGTSSNASMSVCTDANGKITTEAKNNHTHDYSKVSVSPTKTSGVEIGRITVDGTEKILYQQDNNTTYTPASATPLPSTKDGTVGTSAKYAREDHVHPFIDFTCGENNTAGYITLLQIKINSTYQDTPIKFEIFQRNRIESITGHIRFTNANNTDPTLNSITHTGKNTVLYLYKSTTSTWQLILKKGENVDSVRTKVYNVNGGIAVTKIGTQLTTLPTGTTDNPIYTSTNITFTSDEKTKLAGIATGANNYSHPSSKQCSHSHGSLANGGTLNSDITSVNKVAVTDSSNNLKTISQLPYSKLSGTPSIPSKTSDLTNDGDGTNVFVKNNDTRLSNARTPTSHTHGNLQNDGKVGTSNNASKNVVTDSNGKITTENKITKTSQLTNDGDGTNVFVKNNDTRLSNARTPTSHTHGKLQNDGQVGATAQPNQNVVTDANGKITTEEKLDFNIEFVNQLPAQINSDEFNSLYILDDGTAISLYVPRYGSAGNGALGYTTEWIQIASGNSLNGNTSLAQGIADICNEISTNFSEYEV